MKTLHDLHPKHWQDPANALIGACMILAPWALSFSRDSTAMSNSVIIGALLLAASLGATFVPRAWEEWTEAALGLWMAASPWVLGFAHLPKATACAFAGGLLVLALALWVLATDKEYSAWWANRAA